MGSSYPLWLTFKAQGERVELTLGHEPSDDFFSDPPGAFARTRAGPTNKVLTGLFCGLACPGDTAVTPQMSGGTHAKFSDRSLEGDYSEVYGTGSSQIVFCSAFRRRCRSAEPRRGDRRQTSLPEAFRGEEL